MHFSDTIKFCPRCGSGDFPEKSPGGFVCEGCTFHFHINASCAVLGLIAGNAGRVLLIRRGRNPGKGKWSVPGGFVDANETAEAALAREIREEVNLEMTTARYLGSFPNPYEYHGVVFPVLDLAFVCSVRSFDGLQAAPDEVESHAFLKPTAVGSDEIAFPSVQFMLQLFHQKATGEKG